MKVIQTFKTITQNLSKMPYRWAWISLFVISSLLFGWFDDVIIWTVGFVFAWWVVPLYYTIEYGVMLPLAILLFRKTAKKMNVEFSLKSAISKTVSTSLPAILYRRIRRKKE